MTRTERLNLSWLSWQTHSSGIAYSRTNVSSAVNAECTRKYGGKPASLDNPGCARFYGSQPDTSAEQTDVES